MTTGVGRDAVFTLFLSFFFRLGRLNNIYVTIYIIS